MQIKLNKVKRVIFCLAVFAALFLYSSCEIGLGDSVDTEAPSLKILAPETGGVLRGNINLNGTWSDDQESCRVTVSLDNVNKETTVISAANATVNADGTWDYVLYTQTSSDVPDNSAVLPDGKYEAKITAYDAAGHSSGEASRTFEIDGTAPLVALSKPASIDSTSPSTYGRSLKIKGLISDDHSVPTITVAVYTSTTDAAGNIVRGDKITLSKSEFTDFDPSDTSVTIAQYFTQDERGEDLKNLTENEKALFNNYKAIYGDESQTDGWDTTKLFFADVTATDKAGNTNENTFLKTNMLKLVEEICGQALEMADLKNILNGSYSGSLDSSKISTVKEILNGTYDSSSTYPDYKNYFANSTNSLSFSINSNANPKYQVSGNYTYTSSSAAEDFGTSEKTGSLTIKVDAGLDGTEFKPNALSVVITKLTDDNELSTETDDIRTLTAANIYYNDVSIENNTTTTDSGTYSIKLSDISDFLNAGKCYNIKVSGADIDGNQFMAYNDNNYGFMCQVTATPASVNCEKNKTYIKASELKTSDKLTVEVENDDVEAEITLNAYVKFYDNAIKTSLPSSEFDLTTPTFTSTLNSNSAATVSNGKVTYSVDIPLGFSSHELTNVYNCTAAVYLTLEKTGASTTTTTYYLYADNAEPTVTFTNGELKNPSATVYVFESGSSYNDGSTSVKGSGYYDSITGNYTVSGKWQDVLNSVTGSGVAALYYTFDENPVNGQGNWEEIYNTGDGSGIQSVNNMWSQDLPIDSQGKKTISFYAVDAVGNQTEVITFANVIFDFAVPALTYKSGVNDEGKTTLTFTGTDTYGVQDISVEVKKDGNVISSGNEYSLGALTSNEETTKSRTLTFENGLDGTYTITATVTDKANRTTKLENIDTEAPSITNNSITDNNAADGNHYAAYKKSDSEYFINPGHGSFTLTGVASDDTGVTSVALTITAKNFKDSNRKLLTVSPDNSGNTNKYSFNFDLSSWKDSNENYDTGADAVLTVKDLAGNITSQSFTINFDTLAPEGQHALDSNGKDLFFRLGEQDRDDGITGYDSDGNVTSANPVWDASIDKDVGGKYSSTTYGNSESITIRGTFLDKQNSSSTTEDGSGVARIYYMVTQNTPTDTYVSDFKSNYATYSYFTPITATSQKTVAQQADRRVFYEDDENSGTLYNGTSTSQAKYNTAVSPDGNITLTEGSTNKTKYYKTITSTFKASIQGFVANSQNYLYLAVVDNVGNVVVDTARVYDSSETEGYKDYAYYLINIDNIVPEVTSDNSANMMYSNGSGELTITGTASDTGAGVSKVEVYASVNGNDVTFPVTFPLVENGSETDKWSATIDASQLGSSGNVTISVKASDNAGNTKTIPAATVGIDTNGPEVIINSVSNAGSENNIPLVNSTVTIKGTANDSLSGLGYSEAIYLYYTTNTSASKPTTDTISTNAGDIASKWIKYSPDDGMGGSLENPWEFKLDSKTLSDDTVILFSVAASDSVGNVGYSDTYKVKVSQDSDRPVITFSNLTLKGTADDGSTGSMNSSRKVWATTDTLYGTITDDDGISALYVVATESDENEPTASQWNSASNIYSNGAWEYTADEGYSVLWFKVVDSENGADNPFISSIAPSSASDTTLLSTPKLTDKASTVNHYAYKTGSGVTATANVLASTVYVQVDTENPKIYQSVWYTQDESVVTTLNNATGDNLQAIIDNPSGYSWKSISEISGTYIGGPDSKIYIMYKSNDKNGIKETSETFGSISTTTNGVTTTSTNTGTKVYPASQSTPYTTGSDYYTQVVKFDISEISSSNSVDMQLKVTDRANRTYTGDYYFAIDNEAPTLEYRNRSDGDSVYGSLSVSVTGRTTENRSTISKLYFGLTKDASTPPSGINATDATELDLTKWIDFTDYVNTSSWSITFDGESNSNASESTTYHANKLNTYMDTLYGSGTTTSYDSKPLYIWVYAVDSLGNTNSSEPLSLKLDVLTQGDKPSVSITYPSSGVTIGGTIRLSGTTEINTDSVQAVWLQIDPSYDEDEGFNEDWATELEALIEDKTVGYSIVKETGTDVAASATSPGSTLKAGILATGTVSSWNLAINTIGEYTQIENGTDDNGSTLYKNRVIAVRACAVSKTNNKLSNYDNFVYFTVDPDSPQFGGYDGAENYILVSADGTKTQKYTSGMWVSGEWFLKGSITHSAGIKTLTKVVSKTESSNLVVEGNKLTAFSDGTEITDYEKTSGGQTYKGFNFKIPVGSSTADAVGKTSFTLNAVDASESHNTANLSVSINYDNKAPSSFTAKTTTNLSATGNIFKQNNKTFTLSGTVVEGGTESGFERNAFYFTRDITDNNTTTRYFIDPMIAKGDTKKANFVKLGTVATSDSAESFTAENGITYDESDGLYWRISSEATIGGTNQLSLSESTLPDNVRVGGLRKINNVIYRIKAISGTTLTIDGEFESESGITVYFALAQVIDNTVTESGTPNTYEAAFESLTNDDDDMMVEGINQNGTSYSWSASINSKNIYDGPVTLHFSYSDLAGNIATATYEGKVCNNAPRLAGLTIATDYNGDGAYKDDDGELKSYWVGSSKTTSTNVATDVAEEITVAAANNSAYMTVKDSTEIRAEIIGGNGNLYYSYNIGTTLGASGNIKGNISSAALIAGNYEYDTTAGDAYMKNGDYINSRTATIKIPISYFTEYNGVEDAKIANSTSSAPTWFQYVIWDETDGTTKFTDSQYATMNIALAVQVHDEKAPETSITPFYWNSSSDNSLYQNSTSNGHIELTDDLPGTTFTTGGSGVYDTDPKVSGKIVIIGYAYDNIRLGEIKASISKSSVLSSAETVAVYKDGSWYDSSSNTLPEGVSVTKGTMEDDGWSFTVSSASADGAYNNENGHRVKWTLSYDTEKITKTADTDVVVTVQAVDKVSRNGSSTTKMDVVPYISGVKTSLSSLKKSKSSVYDRTALGHYPTPSDSKIYLYGFNLKGGTLYDSKTTPASTTLTSVTVSATLKWYSANYFNYTTVYSADVSSLSSGNVFVKVNDVKSLNNDNNNNASGAYSSSTISDSSTYSVKNSYAYNRQPNNDNNNNLTDDLVLDIWEFNSSAAKPISGVISDPVMKISPSTGAIGFAFTNGPLYFSMPGTASSASNNRIAKGENSYAYWQGSYDFMSSVGFTYDSAGHTYGVAAGGDINSTQADRFSLMTDRWGISGAATGGSYDGSNANRLEAIAQYGDSNGKNTGTLNFDKNRIKSPSLATSRKNVTDSTNVYLAYFDDLNEEIRFRYGNLKDSKTAKANFNNFNDAYRDNTIDNANNLNNGKYSLSYCQVIADSSGSSTLGQAGEYVAIDVVQKEDGGDVVVLVWYDAYAGNLMYAYNDNPTAATTGKNKTNWSSVKTIFTGAGEYCQLAADVNGGIHIAGYDSSNGDLKYAYLSSYSADYSEDTGSCTVDSYAIIGQNITIDVALNSSGVAVPYIGYYGLSSTKPKIAYKVSSGVGDGAEDDVYTSNWEVSIVPTASKVPQDRINVGLWKDSSGTIKASTQGSSNAGQYFGTCYGNTTANPVLGYQIRESSTSGYIETAQMR